MCIEKEMYKVFVIARVLGFNHILKREEIVGGG